MMTMMMKIMMSRVIRNGSIDATLQLNATSTSSPDSASLSNNVANALNSSSAAATLQAQQNATLTGVTCDSGCTTNSSTIGNWRYIRCLRCNCLITHRYSQFSPGMPVCDMFIVLPLWLTICYISCEWCKGNSQTRREKHNVERD